MDKKEAIKKQTNIKNLKETDTINHILRIKNIDVKLTKTKKSFAICKLSDASGEIGAKQWDIREDFLKVFQTCKTVLVTGKMDTYNNEMQILIDSLTKVELAEDETQLLDICSVYPVSFLKKEIWKYVQSIKNEWIRKLIEAFFADKEQMEKLSLVPAAVSMHNNTKHGLLEHIWQLLLFADANVDFWNEKLMRPGTKVRLNKDLIFAGLILHDFEKKSEYTIDGGYDPNGNLLGHISRCLIEIGAKASQIPNFPNEIRNQIAHIVSSHHNTNAWGSPDTPVTLEAQYVHQVDFFLSRMDPCILAYQELSKDKKWTDKKIKAIDKPLYAGSLLI